MVKLEPYRIYYLSGMKPEMWQAPHREFGRPESLAARYLGSLTGARTWHLFEVWVGGRERGVVMMSDADLTKLTVLEYQ